VLATLGARGVRLSTGRSAIIAVAVYEFLLFCHVLAAFMLLAMVVMYSSFALGGPAPSRAVLIAQVLDGIGGAGTIIFGIWLAIYLDAYQVSDGWIIAAILLWAAAAETGRRSHAALQPSVATGPDATPAPVDRLMVRWHVIRTVLILLLLADMIWKPGA
jgi:hypothetical protein